VIGISQIGVYIPDRKVSNLDLLEKFDVNESFIKEKIGVLRRARKQPEERSSDLCVKAFDDLNKKTSIDVSEIDCCVVVTQNPDFNIPHTSAIVHGALGLPEECASFDISLGCSGYVYALSIVMAFMQANGMAKGLLFTADPYSDIIDEDDKNTALIFGDAATVTLLDSNAKLIPMGFDFGSKGAGYKGLINEGKLHMNGRAVFGFTATVVPKSITKLLTKLDLEKDSVNRWYLHQGSKYIIDTITQRLELDKQKVVFDMYDYGNTVSSSIPLLLCHDIDSMQVGQKIGLSGFGVGLSWSSAIFQRIN